MAKIVSRCKTCDVSISYYPSQARTYCSPRCRAIDLAASGMPLKPRRGIEVPCGNCEKPVYRMKHQQNRAAFCDSECKNAWQARNKATRKCQLCGSDFQTAPSARRLYCSRACMGAANYKRPLDRTHNGKPALVDHSGYVRVYEPTHPNAFKSGWVLEHRLVVEQALGRLLDTSEHVHHLNHIRTDNRPENLQLLSHGEHSSITGRENGEALKAALEARQKLAEYERRYGPL